MLGSKANSLPGRRLGDATARIEPGAETDFEEAFEHYRLERADLADDLYHEFRRAIDDALRYPRTARLIWGDVRKLNLRRFPYAMIYRLQGDEVVLYAISHLKRE